MERKRSPKIRFTTPEKKCSHRLTASDIPLGFDANDLTIPCHMDDECPWQKSTYLERAKQKTTASRQSRTTTIPAMRIALMWVSGSISTKTCRERFVAAGLQRTMRTDPTYSIARAVRQASAVGLLRIADTYPDNGASYQQLVTLMTAWFRREVATSACAFALEETGDHRNLSVKMHRRFAILLRDSVKTGAVTIHPDSLIRP